MAILERIYKAYTDHNGMGQTKESAKNSEPTSAADSS